MKRCYDSGVRIVWLLLSLVFTSMVVSCEDFVVFDFSEQLGSSAADGERGSLGELFAEDSTKKKPPLGVPEVRVSQGEYGDTIVVAWKSVKNAEYYRVLRRKKPRGTAPVPFIPIKNVVPIEHTSYEDRFDIDEMSLDDLYASYQYKVEARTYAGSKTISLYSLEAYLLMSPRVVQATKTMPAITVSWEAVRGAVYYRVYRSNTKDAFGTELRYTFGKDLRRFVDTDETVSFGKKYYYYIVAVNDSGEESKLFSALSPAIGLRVHANAPKPPQVSASKAESVSGIEVRWDEVSPLKAITYNVFRKSSKSTREIALVLDSEDTSYTDTTSVEENVEYYYSVQAIETLNGEKLIGGYEATLTSDMSEKSQTGYLLSSPKTAKAQRINSSNDVKITWSSSKKATGYEVHRSDSAEGSYTQVGTLQGDVHAYTDIGAISGGATVFYKVLAVRDNLKTRLVSSLRKAKPIEPVPSVPVDVKASRNAYYDERLYQNWLGSVYPVKITWSKAWGATTYTLWRASKKNADAEAYFMIKKGITKTEAYDESIDMEEVGKYYYYKVSAENSRGTLSEQSEASHGYGALSNQRFAKLWYQTLMSAHAKLTHYHKSGMGPVGGLGGEVRETKQDVFGRDAVFYHGKQASLGGIVTIRYRNYAGKTDAHDKSKALLSTSGYDRTNSGIFKGTQIGEYTIGGMYGPAKIKADLKTDSQARASSGGYYTVTQQNGVKSGRIPYHGVY